jgi:hypothetical protein
MTFFAPRTIIPNAYDSGGVTTSTINVPIFAVLGLGLSTSITGRDPLVDGFGLIAFASLFPMVAVLGYGISKREAILSRTQGLARYRAGILQHEASYRCRSRWRWRRGCKLHQLPPPPPEEHHYHNLGNRFRRHDGHSHT